MPAMRGPNRSSPQEAHDPAEEALECENFLGDQLRFTVGQSDERVRDRQLCIA